MERFFKGILNQGEHVLVWYIESSHYQRFELPSVYFTHNKILSDLSKFKKNYPQHNSKTNYITFLEHNFFGRFAQSIDIVLKISMSYE